MKVFGKDNDRSVSLSDGTNNNKIEILANTGSTDSLTIQATFNGVQVLLYNDTSFDFSTYNVFKIGWNSTTIKAKINDVEVLNNSVSVNTSTIGLNTLKATETVLKNAKIHNTINDY